MKLTKETLKQIIKEEMGTFLHEQDEIDNTPPVDRMGDPLSPEEKKQADYNYQKSLEAEDNEDIRDIVQQAINAGKSKEEFLKIVAAELEKY